MTSTSAPPEGGIIISVRDQAQLIAAIPHLLGFRPADSVVVLGLGGSTGKRIEPVVRVDLPAAAGERGLAQMLATLFTGHPGRAVTIVIVGGSSGRPPDPRSLPQRRFVARLIEAFTVSGRAVEQALWTPEIRAGAPWARYGQSGGGVLPDDSATAVAAAMVSSGFVTFDSREEMARQLDADDPIDVARREKLLRSHPAATGDVLAAFRDVRLALDRAMRGELNLSDEQVVRLATALSQDRVRAGCLAVALPPASEQSLRAEALWLELVRKLPAPERAHPAALLGYSAYVRGDGAFARVAFENALAALPGYPLADLLLRCLVCAVPPHRLHHLGHAEDLAKLVRPPGPASIPEPGGEP